MTRTTNVPYPDDHDAIMARAAFRVLESFDAAADDEISDDVRDRLAVALSGFPELAGETITVAQRQPWDDKLGRADMLNRIIYLPVSHHTSFITLYHELGHLAVQVRDERGDDVPTTSEEYCSLLAMSRMPVEHIDEDRIPYFGEPAIEKDRWPDVCDQALAYREDHHDYVQQARRWLGVADDGGEQA